VAYLCDQSWRAPEKRLFRSARDNKLEVAASRNRQILFPDLSLSE
jgi:hypothetical protein